MFTTLFSLLFKPQTTNVATETPQPFEIEDDDDNNYKTAEELYAFSQKLIDERVALMARNVQLKGRLRLAEQMLSERPPVWVPDDERSQCFACSAPFNIVNRRHHCRACGELFDARCTAHAKLLVAYPKAGPQRVCDACFEADEEGPAFDIDDLDSSALVALGFGGTEAEDEELFGGAIPIHTTSPPVKPNAPREKQSKSCTGCSSCKTHVEASNVGGTKLMRSASGRIRSEIPPAPPFPTQLPKSLSAPGTAVTHIKNVAKKPKAAFIPPANAVKRVDYEELMKGISKLRKAPSNTPMKQVEAKPDAIAELRLSLRRRRKSLEDSLIVTPKGSPTDTKGEAPKNTVAEAEGICLAEENNENVCRTNRTPLSCSSVAASKAPTSGMKAISLMDGLRETVIFKDSAVNSSMNSSWVE